MGTAVASAPYNATVPRRADAALSNDTNMQGILRLVILLAFAAILVSLGSALFHLARGQGRGDSAKMARALTWRIALSVLLFLLIMAAWWAGLITPHGLPPPR